MRHIKTNRNGTIVDTRRLSRSAIILPPITATWTEREPTIVKTKLWVNKASKSSNGMNGAGELVTIGRSQTDTSSRDLDPGSSSRNSEGPRAAQLEQNIRFLQEQHAQMLAGLHREIDSLRHCNRELQFQLVFAKGNNPGIPSPSSSSSSEDDVKHKPFLSPKQINITPLQVELLERELGEMKIHMQDVNSRNVYLSAIVDEQKKKLERYERERERERGLPPDAELLRKLDDAESLIRRMRRENDELRRENSSAGTSGTSNNYQPRGGGGGNGGSNGRGGGGRYHRGNNYRGGGGGGGGGGSNNHRFPPLHSQSYWQQGQGQGRGDSREGEQGGGLPSLGGGPGGAPQSNGAAMGGHQGNQYQGSRRAGGGNNNQYQHQGDGGGGRKYRGGGQRGPKPPSS